MAFASSVYSEKQTEEAFRIYITDQLYYMARGNGLTRRFADLLKIHPEETDDRSGNEVAIDVIKRLDLKVV